MTRRWALRLALALIVVPAVSCEDWEIWDDVFRRPSGWLTSDAGYGMTLPGGIGQPTRTLWLFGDTLVGELEHSAEGEELVQPAWPFISNSIAVHENAVPGPTPPAPDQIHFYARDALNAVVDISSMGPGFPDQGFEFAAPPSGNDDHWLWPGDGTFIFENGSLVLFYSELGCPNGGFSCFGDFSWELLDLHVFTVSNPEDPVEDWNVAVSSLRRQGPGGGPGTPVPPDGLHWGNAVYYDFETGWVYIFGREASDLPLSDLKVAAARPEDVGDYDQWVFAKPGGWQTGPPTHPDQLETRAEDVPSEFTVDHVSVGGVARFLLAHGNFPGRDVVIRTSIDPGALRWSPAEGGTYWSNPIPEIDSGIDPDSRIWAVKGQDHLSEYPNFVVSYFAETIPGELGRLRFMNLPLTHLPPWCEPDCPN